MASLKDILTNGRGVAGAWRVHVKSVVATPDTHFRVLGLWHYSTEMLCWREDNPADEDYLDYRTGWGSVSDQQGMNKAFRQLGIPLYFSRRGGASINDATV